MDIVLLGNINFTSFLTSSPAIYLEVFLFHSISQTAEINSGKHRVIGPTVFGELPGG